MNLVAYNPEWEKIFLTEKETIAQALGNDCLEIEHIGSTAIPGILSKPIVDIAVRIPSLKASEKYLAPLQAIGYTYFPERSSVERMFLAKGVPPTLHLSLTESEKFSYWKRQILFRDYLRSHADIAKEYEILKANLIQKYPDISQGYSDGKGEFVKKVLSLTETNK